jgi:hypothetical protein
MTSTEIEQHVAQACRDYTGNSERLRNAIGVAFMCQQYGWRTPKLTHSSKAWKQYKEILGIDFEKEFPEETEIARKFVAYKLWKATGRFWDTQRSKTVVPKTKSDIEPYTAQ